jgi:PLP dependent protein
MCSLVEAMCDSLRSVVKVNYSMKKPISQARILENYRALQDRVERAKLRAGRIGDKVQIIGVTKYIDAASARFLAEAGCLDLGESRPQAIWEKAMAMSDLNVRWHMIGHLQRNKSTKTMPYLSMLHSIDSARLLQQVQADVASRPNALESLLEINVSGDDSKTGLIESEAEGLLDSWVVQSESNPNLKIVGLMGMGSLEGGSDKARSDFERLRQLRDQWVSRFGLPLVELSMGMSGDFEIAIEQGATMVRIGSILFADNGDD